MRRVLSTTELSPCSNYLNHLFRSLSISLCDFNSKNKRSNHHSIFRFFHFCKIHGINYYKSVQNKTTDSTNIISSYYCVLVGYCTIDELCRLNCNFEIFNSLAAKMERRKNANKERYSLQLRQVSLALVHFLTHNYSMPRIYVT